MADGDSKESIEKDNTNKYRFYLLSPWGRYNFISCYSCLRCSPFPSSQGEMLETPLAHGPLSSYSVYTLDPNLGLSQTSYDASEELINEEEPKCRVVTVRVSQLPSPIVLIFSGRPTFKNNSAVLLAERKSKNRDGSHTVKPYQICCKCLPEKIDIRQKERKLAKKCASQVKLIYCTIFRHFTPNPR